MTSGSRSVGRFGRYGGFLVKRRRLHRRPSDPSGQGPSESHRLTAPQLSSHFSSNALLLPASGPWHVRQCGPKCYPKGAARGCSTWNPLVRAVGRPDPWLRTVETSPEHLRLADTSKESGGPAPLRRIGTPTERRQRETGPAPLAPCPTSVPAPLAVPTRRAVRPSEGIRPRTRPSPRERRTPARPPGHRSRADRAAEPPVPRDPAQPPSWPSSPR